MAEINDGCGEAIPVSRVYGLTPNPLTCLGHSITFPKSKSFGPFHTLTFCWNPQSVRRCLGPHVAGLRTSVISLKEEKKERLLI